MKILMFGWEFPPHNSGGLGVACQGLVQALADENSEVIFVLPRKISVEDARAQFRFAEGVELKVCSIDTLLAPYLTAGDYRLKVASHDDLYAADIFGEVRRYARAASKIALEESFDIIHAHDWLSFCAGVAAKETSGKPLVLHMHLPAVDQALGGYADPRVFAVEKDAMQKADAIIAISNRMRDVLIEKYDVYPDKIHVVHNGVAPDETAHLSPLAIKRDPRTRVALYLGRLTGHKGPDIFLHAAKIVAARNPHARFIVAGSGEMLPRLIDQAVYYGIADRVFFTGFVRGDEKNRLYKTADVFVMPSIAEPFGLVALEAASAGTPVIVSKQSGASEVMRHALSVDFWDVEEMANKICSIFSHAPLRQAMAREAGKEVKISTWKKAAQKCLNIYNAYIKQPRHTTA